MRSMVSLLRDQRGGRSARPVVLSAVFAAVYAVAVVVGRATRVEDSQLALVWPATGGAEGYTASIAG